MKNYYNGMTFEETLTAIRENVNEKNENPDYGDRDTIIRGECETAWQLTRHEIPEEDV